MKQLYFISFSLLFFICSCKTASKAYNQGNYDAAISLAIKKLQKNPNDGDAKAIVKSAYAYAVNQHEDQIRILSNSMNDNRWDGMVAHYIQLQNLYQTLNRYPATATLVNAIDYSSDIQTYSSKAAGMHYNKGMQLMQEDEKHAYRLAYQEFRAALSYQPDDYDIKKQMDNAYDLGMVKVVIAPMDDYDQYYRNNNPARIHQFQDNIIHNLNAGMGSNFIKFFSGPEARNLHILPDEALEMRFKNITIGRPVDESQTRKVSKEVVVKETVYSKDSVAKQYAKVVAQITTTRRTLVSNADLYIASHDASGAILWQDVVRGEHQWQIEFTTYTGDERALSDSDKELLKTPVYDAPGQEAIFNELLKQIDAGLINRVRKYYTQYQ